jgi:hypothetical protein
LNSTLTSSPGRAGWPVEQDRELLGDQRVLGAWGGDDVVDTLPDLVAAVRSGQSATIEKLP